MRICVKIPEVFSIEFLKIAKCQYLYLQAEIQMPHNLPDPDQFVSSSLNSREFAKNEEQLRSHCEEMEETLQSRQGLDKAFYLGRLGTYYRVLGEFDKSHESLDKALEIVQPGSHQAIAYTIRKAYTWHWQGEFQKALDLLGPLCELESSYQHFALQHRGKCLMDFRQFAQAKQDLEKALKIRVNEGNESLIQGNLGALQQLKEKSSKS